MEHLEKLKEFVVNQRWEGNFTKETELRKDLKLWGDDAAEFLAAYGKEFNVALSQFNFDRYFPPEGDFIMPAVIRALRLKEQPKYSPLTIGDLEEGINRGKLV